MQFKENTHYKYSVIRNASITTHAKGKYRMVTYYQRAYINKKLLWYYIIVTDTSFIVASVVSFINKLL